MLTIRGEKKAEREEKKKDYYLSERSYGTVQRSFELPEGVDADKISAKFEKGVLSLSLPKSKEAKAKEKKDPHRVEVTRDGAADFRELVVRQRGPRAAKAVVRSRGGVRAAPAAAAWRDDSDERSPPLPRAHRRRD